jgi:hypothetical protein
MRGLVPRIHVLLPSSGHEDVDGRVIWREETRFALLPGHDEAPHIPVWPISVDTP